MSRFRRKRGRTHENFVRNMRDIHTRLKESVDNFEECFRKKQFELCCEAELKAARDVEREPVEYNPNYMTNEEVAKLGPVERHQARIRNKQAQMKYAQRQIDQGKRAIEAVEQCRVAVKDKLDYGHHFHIRQDLTAMFRKVIPVHLFEGANSEASSRASSFDQFEELQSPLSSNRGHSQSDASAPARSPWSSSSRLELPNVNELAAPANSFVSGHSGRSQRSGNHWSANSMHSLNEPQALLAVRSDHIWSPAAPMSVVSGANSAKPYPGSHPAGSIAPEAPWRHGRRSRNRSATTGSYNRVS